jgi:CO/xanthine dehydrogenase FAD-binding subunit
MHIGALATNTEVAEHAYIKAALSAAFIGY